MKVFYSRVSTLQQNEERQVLDLDGFDYIFNDKCSGMLPLWERPKGSQIKKLLDEGKLTHLEIHSIDRLARDMVSSLTIYKQLTELGVRVVCRNPNLTNLKEDGSVDTFTQLMIGILTTFASFEYNLIRERQMEGIKIRKEKGLYSGRRIGTSELPEKFLSKEKNKRIVDYIQRGYAVREIASILKCSPNTIAKTKRIHEQLLLEQDSI